MKKISLLLVKCAADLSLTVTRINVNSICYAKSFQPKLPQKADKLKNLAKCNIVLHKP